MPTQRVEWVQLATDINDRNEFFVPDDYEASYLENLEKDDDNNG